jgi:hypothetical protein
MVNARWPVLRVKRVSLVGEPEKIYALYADSDTQGLVDNTGTPLKDDGGNQRVVQCPSFGRGARIADPFTVVGAQPDTRPTACCRRGSEARMEIRLSKAEQQPAVAGELLVTPRLRDRSGAPVSSGLKAVRLPFSGATGSTNVAVNVVDLGTFPDQVGLFTLELAFQATPGAKFNFQSVTTRQHVLCTWDVPLDPTEDVEIPVTDTLSGTRNRMRKLMSFLPATSTDVEDMLWRLHLGINDSTPPNFFNKLGVEITHNGELKRFLGPSGLVNRGIPFPLVEQWLMWTPNTGSPPWNHAACAGYVQLLKTMAATLGINVRRTLVLPVTPQLPPPTPGAAKPSPLPLSALTVETPMVIADAGLDMLRKLRTVSLTGLDGKPYEAHPALMEPNQGGEVFEACGVTPAGKYLPGGFSSSRLAQTGVPNWTNGTSGAKGGADWTKAQRGFDSAVDVVRWWTSTTTPSGYQRFMCWVAFKDDQLKWCWDVDGVAYAPNDYDRIRNTGKQLPPP